MHYLPKPPMFRRALHPRTRRSMTLVSLIKHRKTRAVFIELFRTKPHGKTVWATRAYSSLSVAVSEFEPFVAGKTAIDGLTLLGNQSKLTIA